MAGTEFLPEDLWERLTRVATDLCYCSQRLNHQRIRSGKSPDQAERATLHRSEQDTLDPLLEDGFEFVDTGVGRCVLRFPPGSSFSDYIVKFARFGDDPFSAGFVQNKRETVIWNRHGTTGQWPLLPVEDYHSVRFRWIVMRYGKQVPEPPDDELKEALQHVRSRLAMFPIHIQELRADNFVLVDNSLLMADYGRPDGV